MLELVIKGNGCRDASLAYMLNEGERRFQFSCNALHLQATKVLLQGKVGWDVLSIYPEYDFPNLCT